MSRLRRHLRILRNFQTQIDAGYQRAIANHGPPSCHAECNACCRMQVQTEVIEAQDIIERSPRVVWSRAERIRELDALMRTTYPDDPYEAAAHHWRKQLPCVLLGDDGRCSVYEARPMACRSHYVLSDPALCAKVPSAQITIADYGQTRDRAVEWVAEIGAQSRSGAGATGGDAVYGPLPMVLAEVMRGSSPPRKRRG